jgi:drug/metabolite transporter (DMT)-like permease
MSWFYLALLAPLLYAVVNLLDDNLLRSVYKSPYLAAAFTGFFGTLPLLSRLFINAAALPHLLIALSLMAGFLTVAYYFFYFRGLASDSPSIVIALFGLAPATIPFFAHFIVHEQLLTMEVIGFVIVLLASLGLAISNLKQLKISKALIPIIIAVVFVDIISITTKYVYQKAHFYPVYMYFSAGMGLGGIYFLGLKSSENLKTLHAIRKSIKKLLPIFIAVELVNLAAEFTLNLAISRGPVSLVEVIEGIQPMFVLLITLLLYPLSPKYFREAEEGSLVKKFALMTLGIAGLVLISVAVTKQ